MQCCATVTHYAAAPFPHPFPHLGAHCFTFCRCRVVCLGHFVSVESYSVWPFVPCFPRSASRPWGPPAGWRVSALRPSSRLSHGRCLREGFAFCLRAVGSRCRVFGSGPCVSVTRGLASLTQGSPAFPLLSWSLALCLGSEARGCPSRHTRSFCAPVCRHLQRPPRTPPWVNSGCARRILFGKST